MDTINEQQMSGMGRAQLETIALGLQSQLSKLRGECREACNVMDGKDSRIRMFERQVTELQTRGTELVQEVREANRTIKGLRLMLDGHPWCWILVALDAARKKHPHGSTFHALVEEVGEVARVQTKELADQDRRRAELADVAVVAIRLFLGEEDKGGGPG